MNKRYLLTLKRDYLADGKIVRSEDLLQVQYMVSDEQMRYVKLNGINPDELIVEKICKELQEHIKDSKNNNNI